MGEEVKSIEGALPQGTQDGRQDSLSHRTVPGAIATPDFAVDGGGSHCLFSGGVGSAGQRIEQEAEPVGDVIPHELGQLAILGMTIARRAIGEFAHLLYIVPNHGLAHAS